MKRYEIVLDAHANEVGLDTNVYDADKEKKQHIILLNSLNSTRFINLNEVLYCKSEGRYTTFVSEKEQYVVSKNIGKYEETLKAHGFFRIHNSYLINIQSLYSIERKGGYYCKLIDGTLIPVSNRRYELLINTLKGMFIT